MKGNGRLKVRWKSKPDPPDESEGCWDLFLPHMVPEATSGVWLLPVCCARSLLEELGPTSSHCKNKCLKQKSQPGLFAWSATTVRLIANMFLHV